MSRHIKTKNKKAVVLLSGGLDSATTASIAKSIGFDIYALSFDYGQRHNIEIDFAKKVAKQIGVTEHKIANIDLRIFGKSALTDDIKVPKNNYFRQKEIPITYVPARNTIFLAYALAYAETINSFDIFIGVNAIDYSGYPDCRKNFIKSFEKTANLGTAIGVKKNSFKIHTPLIKMSKQKIIQTGFDLGLDYSNTHSCYDPIIKKNLVISCGECDSCLIRLNGFKMAKKKDLIEYRTKTNQK